MPPVAPLQTFGGEGVIPQADLFNRAQGDQRGFFVPDGSAVIRERLLDGLEGLARAAHPSASAGR